MSQLSPDELYKSKGRYPAQKIICRLAALAIYPLGGHYRVMSCSFGNKIIPDLRNASLGLEKLASVNFNRTLEQCPIRFYFTFPSRMFDRPRQMQVTRILICSSVGLNFKLFGAHMDSYFLNGVRYWVSPFRHLSKRKKV